MGPGHHATAQGAHAQSHPRFRSPTDRNGRTIVAAHVDDRLLSPRSLQLSDLTPRARSHDAGDRAPPTSRSERGAHRPPIRTSNLNREKLCPPTDLTTSPHPPTPTYRTPKRPDPDSLPPGGAHPDPPHSQHAPPTQPRHPATADSPHRRNPLPRNHTHPPAPTLEPLSPHQPGAGSTCTPHRGPATSTPTAPAATHHTSPPTPPTTPNHPRASRARRRRRRMVSAVVVSPGGTVS